MSTSAPQRKLTPLDIAARKGVAPIVCLTAYTAPMARLIDAHCDLILVGDSLGMVIHGLESTVGVTMEMMVMHGKAVNRGMRHSVLVIDMPFGSYEQSKEHAYENAAKLISEAGASAVKLEGGQHMAETIRFIVDRGIPVMGHVGLTPQAVNALGGYKVQGRGKDSEKVIKDSLAVANAGAFSIVLEKVPATLAEEVTNTIDIPTIGIGASAACDGQILVTDDMIGMFTEFRPKFVKRYAELDKTISSAAEEYAKEVRARTFPAQEHVFD